MAEVNEQMKPHLIKAHLLMKGITPGVIATRLDIEASNVSHVIHGRRSVGRIAKEISRITGYSIEELWPHRYQRVLRRAA